MAFWLNQKALITKQVFGLFFLLSAGLTSGAQDTPASKEAAGFAHVYTRVEKMPQMPGGGGMAGIDNEFLRHFQLPKFTSDGSIRYSGIYITFVVGPDGLAQDAEISENSSDVAIGDALLAVARNLPGLNPCYHDGQAIPMRLTISVNGIKPQL